LLIGVSYNWGGAGGAKKVRLSRSMIWFISGPFKKIRSIPGFPPRAFSFQVE